MQARAISVRMPIKRRGGRARRSGSNRNGDWRTEV